MANNPTRVALKKKKKETAENLAGTTCFMVGNIFACRPSKSKRVREQDREWPEARLAAKELKGSKRERGRERQKTLITLSYVTFLYLSHQSVTYAFVPPEMLRRGRGTLPPLLLLLSVGIVVVAAAAAAAILQFSLLSFFLCFVVLLSVSFYRQLPATATSLSLSPPASLFTHNICHTLSSLAFWKVFVIFYTVVTQHKRDFSLLLLLSYIRVCMCVCVVPRSVLCIVRFCHCQHSAVSCLVIIESSPVTPPPLLLPPVNCCPPPEQCCGCTGCKLHFCQNKWYKTIRRAKHFSTLQWRRLRICLTSLFISLNFSLSQPLRITPEHVGSKESFVVLWPHILLSLTVWLMRRRLTQSASEFIPLHSRRIWSSPSCQACQLGIFCCCSSDNHPKNSNHSYVGFDWCEWSS